MSKPSCDACTRLREYNANFIMNGVTDTVAESLANNTGLNPCLTELHTDCEDLNDVNDCLIGHMDDEVDNYEVCDWKDLLHNFFPNLYETLKAIIAAVCGLWTNVTNLWKKATETDDRICAMMNALTSGGLQVEGKLTDRIDGTDIKTGFTGTKCTFGAVNQSIVSCEGATQTLCRYVMQITSGSKLVDGTDNVLATWTHDDLVPYAFTEAMWNYCFTGVTQEGDSFPFYGGEAIMQVDGGGLAYINMVGTLKNGEYIIEMQLGTQVGQTTGYVFGNYAESGWFTF